MLNKYLIYILCKYLLSICYIAHITVNSRKEKSTNILDTHVTFTKRNHMHRRKSVDNIYQIFNRNYSRNGFIGNFHFILLISDCFNFYHIVCFHNK